MLKTSTLIAALAVCGSSLQAQQALAGTWDITYQAGMRIENGVENPIIANATLNVEVRADSTIGTLTIIPGPEMPSRPPTRMAAANSQPTVFVVEGKATINHNGVERELKSTSTWTLSATGDTLTGTLERNIEGLDQGAPPPVPVKGTRKKA